MDEVERKARADCTAVIKDERGANIRINPAYVDMYWHMFLSAADRANKEAIGYRVNKSPNDGSTE